MTREQSRYARTPGFSPVRRGCVRSGKDLCGWSRAVHRESRAPCESAGLYPEISLRAQTRGRRVSAKWRTTGLHGLSSSSRTTLCSSEPRVSPVRGTTGEPYRLGPVPKQDRTKAKPGYALRGCWLSKSAERLSLTVVPQTTVRQATSRQQRRNFECIQPNGESSLRTVDRLRA